MKKTLLICGRYPLPEDHGSPMRTMNFVRFFQRYGSIDIAYSRPSRTQNENSTFSHEYVLKIKEVPKNFMKRAVRFMRGIPVPIHEFTGDSQQQLRSLIESNNYRYIIVRYLHNASILRNLPLKHRLRTIMDFDDILSNSFYESIFHSSNGLYKKSIVSLNKKLLMNYEKKCLTFGASLFCSEKDRSLLVNTHENSNAYVVPNIYGNKSFEDHDFGNGFENGNTLLFVGSLGYTPNVHGLRWFIESIFPYFRREYSDARLVVVGRSPDAEAKRICAGAGIELHANVPDIRGYYRRCKAVIVPLLAGGGTRIKILEAALADRPVISTPVGAEGLDLDNNLLLFESAQEFFSQYDKLNDRGIYNSLIKSAKEKVLTQYSEQRFKNAMETVLSGVEQKIY